MIAPTITLDTKSFNDTLRRYVAKTKHTLPYVLNKKLLYIARGAWKQTPVADRGAILSAFNATSEQKISKKTGKMRNSNKYGYSRLAMWVAIEKLKKKGKAIPAYSEMKKLARKVVAGRLRAVHSLAAGWRKPIRTIATALSEAVGIDAGGPRIHKPGWAKPATDGWNPISKLSYEMASVKPNGAFYIDPRLDAALDASFQREQASMEQYLKERMQKDIDSTK
jgi:hypothetical protein